MAKKALKPTPTKASKSQTTAAPSGGDLESAWNQSRTKPPAKGDFAPADIEDGDYALQLATVKVGQYKGGNKKGTSFMRFKFTVVAGPYTGTDLTATDDISTRAIGERTAMDLLSARLQNLGVETSKISLKELPKLAQVLSDPKHEMGRPFAMGTVKNNFSEKDGKTTHFQNVYVNEPLTPEQVTAIKKELGTGGK